MKTIISTLIALVFFVAPTFVAGGVARPESGGKGHTLAKERRQLPQLPTVDVNKQLTDIGTAASNAVPAPAAPAPAPAPPAPAAARRSLQDRD